MAAAARETKAERIQSLDVRNDSSLNLLKSDFLKI